MSLLIRTICLAICGFALSLSLLSAASETDKEKCCFTNPRYTGTCVVEPAEGETCAGILAYLNNPNAIGKNYCGNTKVRGGWKQVTCKEETVTARTCRKPQGLPY
jgi:hypothetical protein